ncbi:MAG: T9SS type A sorting domain-containing protein [Paludibacter sp.]|nr:T9SS type A sorting domain-containing protein [Paludibacter sp.]
MIKTTQRIILLFILSIFLVSWGNGGHYIINNKSPESFPVSMNAFRVWTDSLSMNASAADIRKSSDPDEGIRHYIDLDNYDVFLSKGRIPQTYDSVVNTYGLSFVKANGTLPWATLNTYDSLKLAFIQRRWNKAMLFASDLGHYVADGHMPLHLTANYDGQLTNQKGIHSRYESTMVSTFIADLRNYGSRTVNFVPNVNKYIFDYMYLNYKSLADILAADIYAKNLTESTSSSQYYAALWSKTQVITTTLFQKSSQALAELIYTAWVESGSPAYKSQTGFFSSPSIGNGSSFFPNPTKGAVKMKDDNIYKTEILDLTGKIVGTFFEHHFDVSHLPNGMYLLNIYERKGGNKMEKVLLLK